MTPLHWAVQNGHKMVAELLLKNGAEVKVSNKFSISPQDTARQINKWEILELLQSKSKYNLRKLCNIYFFKVMKMNRRPRRLQTIL